MTEFHTYDNPAAFIEESVQAIERALKEALEGRQVIRVALSGGKSPVEVYRALARLKTIPWSRVCLFLADERYVPLNSKDSNTRLLDEVFLSQVKNLRRFYGLNTREDIAILVDQYQKTLEQFEAPLFDLVVLGMGADGHTASLFPHDPAIHEKKRLTAHTRSLEQTTQDRVSLTFPAILNSRKIIVLVRGAEKEAVLKRWQEGRATVEELPVTALSAHPRAEVFYLPR